MDVTPVIAADRKVIDGYGAGGFRISGVAHDGSVIVFPEAVRPWSVTDIAELDVGTLAGVAAAAAVEILLVGCGARQELIPRAARDHLRDAGIALEAMDTGAACRTYNVLLAEDRRVAAALIPIK